MAVNLSPYKLKTLKQICFLAGCPAASNKTAIHERFHEYIRQARVLPKHARVVSVDMGIRNLAYCVFDIQQARGSGKVSSQDTTELKVNTWKKLDLTEQLYARRAGTEEVDLSTSGMVSSGAPKALFTPASVSKLAYAVTKQLLEYKPDVILIEEQRFRSAGGSAIQEWTVRVNMLESMLWACLETQRHNQRLEGAVHPAVYSVNPAKVAKFWIAGNTTSLSPTPELLIDAKQTSEEPPTRAKITKKDKIDVLQGWLSHIPETNVSLTFSDEAQEVAELFAKKSARGSKASAYGKLDDLTDCLLQGAAWVRWQQNSSKILQLLNAHSKEAPA